MNYGSVFIRGWFPDHTGQKEKLWGFPGAEAEKRAGSAYYDLPKIRHEKTLQTLICKVSGVA